MRNHTSTSQALTIISTITALASATYIGSGVGFMWAPWAYSLAWLLLISSLAYVIPQIDTVIALATTVARHIIHAARHAHDWLAALADRRQSPARVVRSTTRMEAGR
ncbi:hypothetical protein PG2049B_1330 [Bifidobacterium pseudolongum subsp. globosum]|uniref:Uncharacterized protein n=1 Tax=Bifidobacterium pseudolongum subsp. globosum TaxID=1690 RepID=A0A4Q5AIK6_9BIFI|nr:hypothetical protein [Bifidobacterium pseudolongum]RYQ21446.1 hypothetical protein PG2049B_1330 [Bifidobacterium pseudolongum subsp. globosum]RYQ30011.1 hypothetical protein PG2017B_1294 [Bifidobacterium pseudolongum subsp. globosum]